MAANHQQTIVLNVDKKQLKALFKDLGLVQKRIQKINQTGLQLNRVRSRTRNIKGTGLNLGTSENRQAPGRNPSARVQKQTAALNKANAELNKYVRTLSTADGAQRGFTGSANKMSTQVSALRDRLRGLARSNSEYTSTLQAVQRGEQALFQDRNKRLGDQSRTLGSKGGAKDLVPGLLNATDITQSVDGLNNYISRLETLKNKVNINSREFQQLQTRIAEVNKTLEKTQFNKVKEVTQKRFPQTELGSPQEFQQRQQFAEQRQTIEEQIANTAQRINDSKLKAVTKEKLLNDLKRSGLKLEQNQFKVAKQINIETQKNLIAQEKAQARRARITSSTLIGGGFPLLFGGGPLQAAAGALGGNIGERMSPGGGFAGSIAATALVSSMQKFADSARDVGNALKDATLGLDKLNELGFEVDQSTQKQIENLIKVGKVREAEAIVNQKFANLIGPKNVKNLQDLDTAFDELQKETSKLFLQLSSELAPAFVVIINLVKGVVDQINAAATQRAAANLDPTAFRNAQAQAQQQASAFANTPILKDIPFVNTALGNPELEQEILTKLSRKIIDENSPDLTTGKTPSGLDSGSGSGSSSSFSKQELDILNSRIALQQVGDDLLNKEVVAKKQAVIEAERLLAVAKAEGDADQIALANGNAKLKNNELDTAVKEKQKALIDNTIGQLGEEKLFLEESLTLGKDKAEIEKRIRDLVKDLPPERHKEVRDLVEGNAALQKRNELTDKYKISLEEINNVLSQGMTNAVMGLIDGTKSLSESLSGVARQLASMFLNRAFGAMFGGLFSEQGSYSRAGGFQAFQYGGVVNGPTLGMVGEGGEPEYIIPASKMDGAMQRYSSGARGGAVIPGGSHAAGTVAGASGNTVVEYTGPTLNFNGDNYVPRDAIPKIISTAAQQGASMGQSKMMNTLKNSRSQRSKLGI